MDKEAGRKDASRQSPATVGPGGPGGPAAGEMNGDEALMAAMIAGLYGGAAGPGAPGQAASAEALASRVTLLEEHFARLCTVVGRLEQELAALQSGPGGHGR